jgi:hypothetical protein
MYFVLPPPLIIRGWMMDMRITAAQVQLRITGGKVERIAVLLNFDNGR